MPYACHVCRMLTSKIHDFFMQPVTMRRFARDLTTIVKSLAIFSVWVASIAHVPSLVFAGLGIWALVNARFFATIFALLCAFAYTKWLWSFIPI